MSLQIEQLALRCSDCGMLMEIPMRFHRLADELLEFCQNEEETHSIICKPTVLPATAMTGCIPSVEKVETTSR
jgi:hypothetical protein